MSNQTTPTVQSFSDADVADTLAFCMRLAPTVAVKLAFKRDAENMKKSSKYPNKEICRILLGNLYSGISFGTWIE